MILDNSHQSLLSDFFPDVPLMTVTNISPFFIDFISHRSSSPSFNFITLTIDDGTVVLSESVSFFADTSFVMSPFVLAMLFC